MKFKKKKKHLHFEILKTSLAALLDICSLLKVRLISFGKKKIMKPKIKAKTQLKHENQIICVMFIDSIP